MARVDTGELLKRLNDFLNNQGGRNPLEQAKDALRQAAVRIHEAKAGILQGPSMLSDARAKLQQAQSPEEVQLAQAEIQRAMAHMQQMRLDLRDATYAMEQGREQYEKEKYEASPEGVAERRSQEATTAKGERNKRLFAGGKSIGTHISNMAFSGVGGAASEAFGIGEDVGVMIGGPVGAAITGVSAFGKIIADSANKLQKWTNFLHQGNMQFAQFSPHMAQVQMEQEVRDMLLNMQKGEALQESAKLLAEAKSRRERMFAPGEVQWQKIKNKMATTIEDQMMNLYSIGYTAGGVLQQMMQGKPLAEAIAVAIQESKKELGALQSLPTEGVPMTEWIRDRADDYLTKVGRPARFNP